MIWSCSSGGKRGSWSECLGSAWTLGWSEQASGAILQHRFCCESEADSSPSCGFPVTRTCLSSLTLLCLLKEEEPELEPVTYSAMGLQQDPRYPKEQACFCFLFLPLISLGLRSPTLRYRHLDGGEPNADLGGQSSPAEAGCGCSPCGF